MNRTALYSLIASVVFGFFLFALTVQLWTVPNPMQPIVRAMFPLYVGDIVWFYVSMVLSMTLRR